MPSKRRFLAPRRYFVNLERFVDWAWNPDFVNLLPAKFHRSRTRRRRQLRWKKQWRWRSRRQWRQRRWCFWKRKGSRRSDQFVFCAAESCGLMVGWWRWQCERWVSGYWWWRFVASRWWFRWWRRWGEGREGPTRGGAQWRGERLRSGWWRRRWRRKKARRLIIQWRRGLWNSNQQIIVQKRIISGIRISGIAIRGLEIFAFNFIEIVGGLKNIGRKTSSSSILHKFRLRRNCRFGPVLLLSDVRLHQSALVFETWVFQLHRTNAFLLLGPRFQVFPQWTQERFWWLLDVPAALKRRQFFGQFVEALRVFGNLSDGTFFEIFRLALIIPSLWLSRIRSRQLALALVPSLLQLPLLQLVVKVGQNVYQFFSPGFSTFIEFYHFNFRAQISFESNKFTFTCTRQFNASLIWRALWFWVAFKDFFSQIRFFDAYLLVNFVANRGPTLAKTIQILVITIFDAKVVSWWFVFSGITFNYLSVKREGGVGIGTIGLVLRHQIATLGLVMEEFLTEFAQPLTTKWEHLVARLRTFLN